MAHISTLGAGIYTYLDVYTGTVTGGVSSLTSAALFAAEFQGGTVGTDVLTMPSIREFPSVGTPANIVNVPVYGQATSSQVQGQADAPSLEITVNYVPSDMLDIHDLVGEQVLFRVMMTQESLTPAQRNAATISAANTEFYFVGKIEAILVNPQLTDATTATVTLSAQSDFYGPATIAAV